MKWAVPLVAALVIFAEPLSAAERSVRIAGLSVVVWQNDAAEGAKQPVIIFSHGFHGCATQSRFLTEALAAAGYLVFAPNHRDALCGGGEKSASNRPELSFRDAREWNDATYRDRADDIRRLIDALRSDQRFKKRADWSRLGLAGHSLGGYTVLGLAGAWPSWKLANVKAVLALSPYCEPFVDHRAVAQIVVPVMYQGGTRDLGITPSVRKPKGAFDQTIAPKYYVEFEGAGHFAWTNLVKTSHDAVLAYSIAFLDHYVKGNAPSAQLTHARADVTSFRYASELGNSATAARRR